MNQDSIIVGWREWVSLPGLGIAAVKAKIDTGAKTSSLHAFDIEVITKDNQDFAKFTIHPIRNNREISHLCIAKIIDTKTVKSSNGHKEQRLVINSPIKFGNNLRDINITLTNRDIMNYRMLIGREAMQNMLVDPKKCYYHGKINHQKMPLSYMDSPNEQAEIL